MFRWFAVFLLSATAAAIDNGVGLTPPMGWRSWNCFHANVSQQKMEGVMRQMAARTRLVDGKATSFADLGYVRVGLDDNWQACSSGVNGSFHDEDGAPIVNKELFPNMKAMNDLAHSLGLLSGWYMNNCICKENMFTDKTYIAKHYERSAAAVAEFEFDGVKLDGCGQFLNLTLWAELLNATGRPVLIENCHWGGTVPGSEGRGADGGPSPADAPCTGTTTPSNCPYNLFRTSGDINTSWTSMLSNLLSTVKFQGDVPLSRPGAWAYPDMLEVGNMATPEEDRSHFGAWVITSSPLILGFDMNNDSLIDRVWPIVSNKEAIRINQAWAGHPGRLVWTRPAAIGSGGDDTHNSLIPSREAAVAEAAAASASAMVRLDGTVDPSTVSVDTSSLMLWAKPLPDGAAALLLLNTSDKPSGPTTVDLADVPGLANGGAGTYNVRDVWQAIDKGTVAKTLSVPSISAHGSLLFTLNPVTIGESEA